MSHTDPFDLDRLRLSSPVQTSGVMPVRSIYRKMEQRFLKGPIPWTWLCRACRLGGKTGIVAIAIWHWVALTKRRNVNVRHGDLRSLGVGRDATRRALLAMERAKLITVTRHTGRSPVVTLLDGPND